MSVEYLPNGNTYVRLPALFKIDTTPEGLQLARWNIAPVSGGVADAWSFTNTARTYLLDGTIDIGVSTMKCALFDSGSNLADTSTTFAGVTAEEAGTGYTAGGAAITLNLAGTTTVTCDIATDPVWTAGAGGITCRFAAIYEVAGNILCWSLLDNTPADVTATSGNTLTVAAHASGVFTLSGG